ncbi:MAG: hypothetical protein IT514_13985, partial [Burkholderiales bacterium]|nr:hypothetical protein [Burkholderiales bacterium]
MLSAFLAGAFAATAQAGSLRVDTDLGASWRLDSIARLMAGLEPSYPQHARIAATQAWKSHSAAMQSMWKRLRAERAVSMLAWRDKHLPGACPGGRTLLYPFSGPDFFNVYWLCPECENFVLCGLEHIGQVPDLESLSERELAQFG